jgi:hypothetical protein
LQIPALAAAAQSAPGTAGWVAQALERHDAGVRRALDLQITDPSSRWRGTYPDEYGIHFPGTASGIVDSFVAAYLHRGSKFHKDSGLPERIRLAIGLLAREQTPDGNWNLPTTNFNSPADTGFIVRNLAPAGLLLKRAGENELFGLLEPVLRKAGAGMVKGGIHTPNHRWVVSSALAELYEIFGDTAYVRRIDQWLAESIDIDSDGQFTERSTYVYNPITDNAFVTMGIKLKRPQLFEPARRNLESMMYLLHPGYEVVTEISRRQDLNVRGDMGPYWFPLAYLAHQDKNGQFATIADHFAPARAGISALLMYPQLAQPGPAPEPVPDQYVKTFPHNRLVHVRRGPLSGVILGGNRNRFFTFRNGEAVVNAVRFASAFFGKGQFSSQTIEEKDGSWILTQKLQGPYYQPLDPPRVVDSEAWASVRRDRRQTEVAQLTQTATITETKTGFRVRIQSFGTRDVPLAVEISLREGGKLDGVKPAHKVDDAFVLTDGYGTYQTGSDAVRFGPGAHAHMYTQVRGAEPKLAGPGVYITGFTPFDHTLTFERV